MRRRDSVSAAAFPSTPSCPGVHVMSAYFIDASFGPSLTRPHLLQKPFSALLFKKFLTICTHNSTRVEDSPGLNTFDVNSTVTPILATPAPPSAPFARLMLWWLSTRKAHFSSPSRLFRHQQPLPEKFPYLSPLPLALNTLQLQLTPSQLAVTFNVDVSGFPPYAYSH